MKTIIFYTELQPSLNIISDFDATDDAIEEGCERILTYSMAHLSFDLIDLGYRIELCGPSGVPVRIRPGMRLGDKEIRKEHNILRFFRAGMFDDLINV